jgi:hypothetical protein
MLFIYVLNIFENLDEMETISGKSVIKEAGMVAHACNDST